MNAHGWFFQVLWDHRLVTYERATVEACEKITKALFARERPDATIWN